MKKSVTLCAVAIGVFTIASEVRGVCDRRSFFGSRTDMYSGTLDKSGEYAVIDLFAKSVGPQAVKRPVVFDVGVWLGQWSYYVLLRCPGACVYGFEPSDQSFIRAEKNLSEFSKEQMTLVSYALSNKSGTGRFATYGNVLSTNGRELGLSSTNSLFAHAGRGKPKYKTVKTVTLDSFCAGRNIDYIDLLKIDAEGGETIILRGAEGMLKEKRIHRIQFEYNIFTKDSKSSLAQLYSMLTRYGYNISMVDHNRLVSISRWNKKLENWKQSNFLAVLPAYSLS